MPRAAGGEAPDAEIGKVSRAAGGEAPDAEIDEVPRAAGGEAPDVAKERALAALLDWSS